jgi:hypothetical protein
MIHTTTNRAARMAIALGATAALLGVGGGAVFAGEITGNGTLKTVHGRSACAYSGQEDLQFFYDDGDTMPKAEPTKGDPGHAQSWGQIDKATRAFLTSIGLNPGIACNPNKASGGE